ncbi:MAG: CDGSH-type Zn-finger protein [Planctomycetota bacterium]|jgi:CDGSH-type Zn-finger protein
MSNDVKASITAYPDGPLAVNGLAKCSNRHGSVETKSKMVLCRCGASANKPYCDGSHKQSGFSSAKQEDRGADQKQHYIGSGITIHDNRSICAHAGYCTDQLAAVFRMKQEPWIDADAATVNEIVSTIKSCPSGALSYSLQPEVEVVAETGAAIHIAENGPYVVSGEIDLVDIDWAEGASRKQFTLCRCGASKNKPFCDGSHWDSGFKDDEN